MHAKTGGVRACVCVYARECLEPDSGRRKEHFRVCWCKWTRMRVKTTEERNGKEWREREKQAANNHKSDSPCVQTLGEYRRQTEWVNFSVVVNAFGAFTYVLRHLSLTSWEGQCFLLSACFCLHSSSCERYSYACTCVTVCANDVSTNHQSIFLLVSVCFFILYVYFFFIPVSHCMRARSCDCVCVRVCERLSRPYVIHTHIQTYVSPATEGSRTHCAIGESVFFSSFFFRHLCWATGIYTLSYSIRCYMPVRWCVGAGCVSL